MFDKAKVIEQCVDDTRVSVRVQLLDKDGIITKPIPVKQFGSRGNGAFWCPEVGDDVSVCFPPNSEYGDGFVDGSFYNTGNPPPVTDPNKRHITFKDGTVIEHDAGTNHTMIDSPGTVSIKSAGNIDVESSGTISIRGAEIKLYGKIFIYGDIIEFIGDIVRHEGDYSQTGIHLDHGMAMPHDA